MNRITPILITALLALSVYAIYLATTKTSVIESEAPFIPDCKTSEKCIKTFWHYIKNNNIQQAVACTNPEKVSQGRHGHDVKQFIKDMQTIDCASFAYEVSENFVRISSPTHSMDYELERQPDGTLSIISIHP